MGARDGDACWTELTAKHPSVGAARSIGLFGIVELVRNRADDASRWRRSTAPRPRCRRSASFFREEGLYTFVRWNTFFTNPPLCITEAELREAFAIIDKGLARVDAAIAATVTA